MRYEKCQRERRPRQKAACRGVMTETKRSNAEPEDASRAGWPTSLRLAGLIVLAAAAVSLVAWIQIRGWTQMARLQAEFSVLGTERFHLGQQVGSGVARLNECLLRYQFSEAPEEREAFHTEARRLQGLLAEARAQPAGADEQGQIAAVATALEAFVVDAGSLLEEGVRGVRRTTPVAVQEEIWRRSEPLRTACQRLTVVERRARDEFRRASQQTLGSLQVLVQGAALLLVGLLALGAVLAYRTLVQPVRARLQESQGVIERQERLASLGTLAAGVAHEIRNPLTAIKFRLFSLRKLLPPELNEAEDLRLISSEIHRLERIVQNFLQFARPSEPTLTRVTTRQLAEETRDLLAAELEKRGIELRTEPGETAWVEVDREQLKQVLLNLVQNAAESMPQGGRVTIRCRAGIARVARRSVPVAIIEVADTGRGIAPGGEERIFDPFFTTKESGSGLGLSIAARIVEQHDGYLQCQSQPETGTVFSVVLPRRTEDANPDPAH